ncbi:hypothetical protein FHR33_003152 [Nonomuraea dietziae]|uniref:Uncharacterized protein n=1 Tax=Nonomuraea dietziae TaxID=65515 RepID=A0A7W5VGD6_9ACTN|nr:hypothetical protein [Nonomuraea dietziae]
MQSRAPDVMIECTFLYRCGAARLPSTTVATTMSKAVPWLNELVTLRAQVMRSLDANAWRRARR